MPRSPARGLAMAIVEPVDQGADRREPQEPPHTASLPLTCASATAAKVSASSLRITAAIGCAPGGCRLTVNPKVRGGTDLARSMPNACLSLSSTATPKFPLVRLQRSRPRSGFVRLALRAPVRQHLRKWCSAVTCSSSAWGRSLRVSWSRAAKASISMRCALGAQNAEILSAGRRSYPRRRRSR